MKPRYRAQVAVLYIVAMNLLFVPGTLIGQSRDLVWSDDFNGSSIDLSRWQFGVGASNDNLQYYTSRAENARVTGGLLQIIARKESYAGYSYTSALLETRATASWRYGRLEARIKLPGSPGFVPAFWLLPDEGMYGWWPYSGEIDIMEYPTTQGGTIYGTVHNQAHSSFTGTAPLGATLPVPDAETAFHTYAIEWSPEQIDFFVDQNKYFTVTNDHTGHAAWPFDRPFYVILNLAVGGGWVGAPTQSSVFPATMEVDYVRVYQTLGEIGIAGKDYVMSGAQAVTYALPEITGATYTWSVPPNAQIVSGQDNSLLTVNWGTSGGDVSALVTAPSGSASPHFLVEVSNNLLSNPGFEKGVKYWKSVMSPVANGSFALDSSAAAHAGHSVKATVNIKPANPWDVQITQQGFDLVSGKQYEGRLWAKAAVSGAKLNAGLINAQTYAYYGGMTFTLTDSWKEYTFRITAPANAPASFNLDLGTQAATYYCDDMVLVRLDGQTGIGGRDGADVPQQSSLEQNYPNPFNPSTRIEYTVAGAGETGAGGSGLGTSRTSLIVYDVLGKEVAVLVNEQKPAGVYSVVWDGKDSRGRQLSSGVYLCRLTAGSFTQTKQMVLVR
jgi:beta-glucanase (GH16 family)